MPQHLHIGQASGTDADTFLPGGDIFAQAANVYAAPGATDTLVAGTVGNVGNSQAHSNMQPYLVLSWCIALQGIFPSPN
jgi:microcystin-dependent protein